METYWRSDVFPIVQIVVTIYHLYFLYYFNTIRIFQIKLGRFIDLLWINRYLPYKDQWEDYRSICGSLETGLLPELPDYKRYSKTELKWQFLKHSEYQSNQYT